MQPDKPALHEPTAIGPALKAATEAVCRYGNGLKCDPEPDCDFCRAHAAAVVTAFLRALPDRFPMPRPGGQTWGHASGEMAKLAALVEASVDG